MYKYNLLAIIGSTATGKTRFAAKMAAKLDGEVISADSRQVYRGMDIGTGKDLEDYIIDGKKIPVHLVNLVDAGYQYNVFEYQRDFLKVWKDLQQRQKFPVLCGGSGLYIEAVLNNYKLIQVPVNETLRQELSGKSLNELTEILKSHKPVLHNITDIVNEKRAIRAIEIARYYAENEDTETEMPDLKNLVVGIKFDRSIRRNRITQRLKKRLEEGMVEEVQNLLKSGLNADDLLYYGLEYKYITQYITGELSYDQMVEKLNIAIHQFSKRQMTWFRRMERNGISIHWLDGNLSSDEMIETVMKLLSKKQ